MIKEWGIITRNINLSDCIDVVIQENDYYLFYDYNIRDSKPLGNRTYEIDDDTLSKLIKLSDKYKSYYFRIDTLDNGRYKFNYLSNKSKFHRYYGDTTNKILKGKSEDNNLEMKKSGEDLREYGYQILVVS